jgi:hypothetical protein
MKLTALGEYNVWYCDWCDTKNLTPGTRFEKEKVFCGACHIRFRMTPHGHMEQERVLSGMI